MSVTDEEREQAKSDWKKGMKYKDIAKKYGVSESTIKSWVSRYWRKGKVATKNKKKLQPKKEKESQPKAGAPKGNRNACGKDSGAPLGNDYALKHGGYANVYWDTLDEKERSLTEDMPTDEEELLLEQIRLFSVRERRIMLAIKRYRDAPEPIALDYTIRTETKRTFADSEEKELFEQKQKDRIENNEILPGKPYNIQTATENKDHIITRLESELSSIQTKKTKAIDALVKLRLERQRIADSTNGNDIARAWVEKILQLRKNESE